MSGWQDSNLRPPRPKRGAMTGLRYTPNGHLKKNTKSMVLFERKTGFEPATFSLEGWRSTNWATFAWVEYIFKIERKTGFEPATFSLEGWRSTNWATFAYFYLVISYKELVARTRVELVTSGLWIRRSNQLSYLAIADANIRQTRCIAKEKIKFFQSYIYFI